MSLPKVTKAQAKRAVEETRPFKQLLEKRVPYDAMRRELKGAVLTEDAQGRITNVHDPTPDKRYLHRLHDMQAEYRALDYEIGQNSNAQVFPEHERQAIRQRDGTVEVLPGHLAEQSARKKGAHAVIRWQRYRERTVIGEDGVHLVYRREPGGEAELVRAYRLHDNGNRTTSEIEVPLCRI